MTHGSALITAGFRKISPLWNCSDIFPSYFQCIHRNILLPSPLLPINAWIPHVILPKRGSLVGMKTGIIIWSVNRANCLSVALCVAHSFHLIDGHFPPLSEIFVARPTTGICHMTVEVLEAWLVIWLEIILVTFQMHGVPDSTITPVLAQICWLCYQILIFIAPVIKFTWTSLTVRTRWISMKHIRGTHIILEDI